MAIALRQETLELDQIVDLDAVQHLNMYPEDVEELLGKTDLIKASLESMVL